jgi:hypothetical protein
MKSKKLVFVSLLLTVLMSSCMGGYYGGYNRYGYNNNYGYNNYGYNNGRYAARPYIRIVPPPIFIAPRYGYSGRNYGGNRGGYGGGHHHGRRRW